MASLTKEQAIAAMKAGKKVTHRYFTKDEWITMVGNRVITEDNASCWAAEFWSYRTGECWEIDWELFI
jgi:hypothetical protein